MIDIKSTIYKFNDSSLIININNESTIEYNNTIRPIDNELIIEYVTSLYEITRDWQNEYINSREIDGSSWKLSIIYKNGNTKEYCGRSASPVNFEAFERLNYKLISEAIYV